MGQLSMLQEFQSEPKVQFIHVIIINGEKTKGLKLKLHAYFRNIISSGENVIQRLNWTENHTPV